MILTWLRTSSPNQCEVLTNYKCLNLVGLFKNTVKLMTYFIHNLIWSMVAQKDKDKRWLTISSRQVLHTVSVQVCIKYKAFFSKSEIFVKLHLEGKLLLLKIYLHQDGSQILSFSNIPLFCILPHMTHFCFWSWRSTAIRND